MRGSSSWARGNNYETFPIQHVLDLSGIILAAATSNKGHWAGEQDACNHLLAAPAVEVSINPSLTFDGSNIQNDHVWLTGQM